jgi:hypothetical protein
MNETFAGEAALRRALQAAAAQVDPSDDGLDKIRSRVRHRRPMPLALAWADVTLTRLALGIPDGFWSIWDRVAIEARAVIKHFWPERGRSSRSGQKWLGWARPVAAMSSAVFIVAAVVYMAVKVPQAVVSAVSTSQSGHTTGPQQPNGNTTGGGQPQTQPGATQPVNPGSPTAGAPNSSACTSKKPAPHHTIVSSPVPPSTSPPTSPPPSPTPTPSDSPTSSSPTPTPTPSDSSGTSPSDGSQVNPSPGTTSSQANTTTTQASTTGKTAGDTASKRTANHKTAANTKSASASPTPCPSSTPKPSGSGSVKISPASIGQLTLRLGGPAAEERAKIS